MQIALAQINPTVGDIAGNMALIKATYEHTTADLIVFPEMALVGYPPEDLILSAGFMQKVHAALFELAAITTEKAMIVGTAWQQDDNLYNVAAFMVNGHIQTLAAKQLLPNTGVFDERRYFTPGHGTLVVPFKGKKLGILICEDLWAAGPARDADEQGADIILALNASPFEDTKHDMRLNVVTQRSRETNLPIVYVNMVGGQDELVFDGNSFALAANGMPLGFSEPWVSRNDVVTI